MRQVNQAGKVDYQALKKSGLYDKLVGQELLIPHHETSTTQAQTKEAVFVLKPTPIPVISYPFEWSFSQLKDAAVATLRIQKTAIENNMTLKDASAYNMQFLDGKPIFIDTLSFETYTAGQPWQAYGQFCRHFLAPLALMAYTDVRLSQLLREHLDGIPLDLTAKLLPKKTRLKPSLLMHIFLHARAQTAKASDHKPQSRTVTKTSQLAIISSLERIVMKLKPKHANTEWGDYYDNTNYSDTASRHKAELIKSFAKHIPKLKTVLDMGGNDGHYSRIFSSQGIDTICADIDPVAVEWNYAQVKKHQETSMLPLLVDVTNPGGGLGWANQERATIHERFSSDLTLALALVHHLAISNNLPLGMIAKYFSRFSPYLIIEFVPKDDSQVQKLLSTRKDIFDDYSQTDFEASFKDYYNIVKQSKVSGSKRMLYLMRRK